MSNDIFIVDLSLCYSMESNRDWNKNYKKTLLHNFVLRKFFKNIILFMQRYFHFTPTYIKSQERNTSDIRYVNSVAKTIYASYIHPKRFIFRLKFKFHLR